MDALELASRDPALPLSTRQLLASAIDAVRTAEAETGRAHTRYRALFDAVPDPISVLDAAGIILDLNKAGLEAYQRPREELVGKPIHVINPDLAEDHLQPVWEILNQGRTCVLEVDNMRADGSRFPVEVHSANFQFNGQACILAVARDLSDRRIAELRYRALMENIDKAILIRDASGRILHANLAALRLFRVEPGQNAADALDPAQWLLLDENGRELQPAEYPAARVLREGRAVQSVVLGFFHRLRHSLTWLSVTAMPQFLPGDERPQQVLSMFSDVTALKRDSALFERAQALARMGGWEWDSGPDQLYLTNEARRIIGRDPVPATMEELLACVIEPDRRRMRQALQQTIAIGQEIRLDLQGMRGDGHPFWVRVIGGAEIAGPMSARLTGTVQDITYRKQHEETLRVRARTDSLTGLLNRDAARVEIEARLEDPTQSALAVLYIDLDRFKVVNDVLGHAAGDRLLASAANRIRYAVGSEGLIARFGGDEFLVLCSLGDDPSRPLRLADSILEYFADAFRLDGEEFSITASIGIAQSPQDGTGSQQLIQAADVAMYASKRSGRNGWQVFTAELAAQQQHRQQLETQLRHAVGNDEFHLVYQPQVELATGRLVSVEALIRWHSQSLGDMPPERFISHAETTGDIVGIGHWVLRSACLQLRQWLDAGLQLERVAVNVSYRQFLGEDLASMVRAALEESGLPGHALELEFTERILIEDEPDALRTFANLRELGVMLTIDDFGEGYSALNYLRRLPIHGLKLSQLFVQGVPQCASDVAVCEAVAGIARSLKLGLVAEGVETEAQRDFLIGLGVTVGQGFLFSRGLQPAELELHYGGRVNTTG